MNSPLQWNPNSIKTDFLLFPPLYGWWMYRFILRISGSNRLNWLATISFLFALLITMVFTVTLFEMIDKCENLTFSPAWFLFFELVRIILIILIITRVNQFEQRNIGTINLLYWRQFVVFYQWPVGIWSLQRIANSYEELELRNNTNL
jgi:hypothetical protein